MHKHIIYLASGNSRRFGSNKLLYPLNGKPIFSYGLEMLSGYVHRCSDATLTVVSQYEEVRVFASALGCYTVDSPDSTKGISYTIRAGLNALQQVAPEDFILFVVADQPYLTEATIDKILSYAAEGTETASLAYGDRPGNPTLFSARLIPELMELEGDKGGRVVIRKHNCIYVQAADERELMDIDRLEDIYTYSNIKIHEL